MVNPIVNHCSSIYIYTLFITVHLSRQVAASLLLASGSLGLDAQPQPAVAAREKGTSGGSRRSKWANVSILSGVV